MMCYHQFEPDTAPSIDDVMPIDQMIGLLDLYADRGDGAYLKLWTSLVQSLGAISFVGDSGQGDRLHIGCPLADGDARRPAMIDRLIDHLRAAGHRDALQAQLVAEGHIFMGPNVKRAAMREGKNHVEAVKVSGLAVGDNDRG